MEKSKIKEDFIEGVLFSIHNTPYIITDKDIYTRIVDYVCAKNNQNREEVKKLILDKFINNTENRDKIEQICRLIDELKDSFDD